MSDLLRIANDKERKQRQDQPNIDPAPKPRPAQTKSKIPDLAAQEKTLKKIEEIFGHPDTVSEKLALAKQLMRASSDEQDPNVRYVLLRYGGTLAIEADSAVLALQAVDDLGQNYQFDTSAMKADVLEKVLSASTAPEILTASLRQFDLCVADDNYAIARRFGQIGYKAATLAGNTEGIGQLRERAARLRKLQAAFDAMKPSIAVLKLRPDDVAANRKVGEFFCYKKDNWKRGLPFLVAGDHATAKLESARPQDATAKKQIGDLWWAEAEKADSPEKENLKRRAGKWYKAALPGLKGLSIVAVEKRLREIPSQLPQKDTPLGPIVSETDAKEARRVVAELYQDDRAKAKTPADKSALAKKILRTGRDTKDDPAVRAALLIAARDTAALAGDVETGFAAIDEMAKHQQANASDMKATMLATIVRSVRRLDRQRELIPQIGATFERAIADGELDAAKRLGNLAASILRRTKDYVGERKVKARLKDLENIAVEYETAKAAQATLRTRPSDPAANLALGRFLCFIKGDWDQGLRKLVLGNDPVLKRLAEQELAEPVDVAAQVKLGDGWWELSKATDPTSKLRVQTRAAGWYQKAHPKLAGLSKVRVENRLDEWKQAMSRHGLPLDVAVSQTTVPSATEILTSKELIWSEPVNLGPSVNSKWGDVTPLISPDGLKLFFNSNRPGGFGKWDIWMCARTEVGGRWRKPVNLGKTINSEYSDGRPAFSNDGLTMLFWSTRPVRRGEPSRSHLWTTKWDKIKGAWSVPSEAGVTVTGPGAVKSRTLTSDTLTLYFSSDRSGGFGENDIWSCTRRNKDAPWGNAVNLGPNVNTNGREEMGTISSDGLTIIFGSYIPGTKNFVLWMATRADTDRPFGKRVTLGSNLNKWATASGASLSRDGRTLFFHSNHRGGRGNWDLWSVSRIPRPHR